VQVVDVFLQIQAQHLEALWDLELNERTSKLQRLGSMFPDDTHFMRVCELREAF
jgi:hypothetical protein